MRIKVWSLNFYSFLKLQEWIVDALNNMGHEASGGVYHRSAVRKTDEPMIFITEENMIDNFVRLCDMFKKKGLAWIDFFVYRKFAGVKMWQDGFRANGGKIVPIGEFEKGYLEKGGVIVDAKIPRPISDDTFKWTWKGSKKRVLSWGFAHRMKEYQWYKHFGCPIELKNVTRKGHELLVEFAEDNPDWEVCLVTQRKALESAISIPKLSNLEIIEAGNIPESEKWDMMANAGVFCFPTRQDSQGTTQIEAEAIGVPTCYTALSQQVEVGGGIEIPYRKVVEFPDRFRLAIIDYEEVRDAIFRTHALGDQLSKYGRENAQRFRASVIAKQLVEVLESNGS